jgi:tetratricopeptide (TPR) repeat protein
MRDLMHAECDLMHADCDLMHADCDLMHADCDLMHADCECMRVLIWPEGMYMSNLAETYSALGRHADALALQERVLDLRRRFLPEDDPEIGEHDVRSDALLFFAPRRIHCDVVFLIGCPVAVMHSLAQKYFSMRKFSDALPKFEMLLEFLRRVRPENDRDIGECDLRGDALHLRSD